MSGLNANASGFVPFGGAPSSATASSSSSSSKLKAPEKPGPDATPEQLEAFKKEVTEYLAAIKKERASLEQENTVKQQQQQQKPKFEIETVYAEDVGYDDDDEAGYFDDFAAAQGGRGGGGGGDDDFYDDDDSTIVESSNEPPLPASQYLGKELDANEMFRIAKTAAANPQVMADFSGVEAELVARESFDLAGQRDSYNRNVIHFAAEGGHPELVAELRKRLGDGLACAVDDKGLMPWQVAVLARHPDCAKLLIPAGGVPGLRGPDDLDDERTFSMLLQQFAPRSTAPVLAFGAKPPTFSENHKMWGKNPAAFQQPSPGAIRTQSIQCSTLDPHDVDHLEPLDKVCNSFGNPNKQPGGLSPQLWAQPLTATEFATRRVFSHLVAAFDAGESNTFLGAAVFSATGMLAGQRVPGPLLGQDVYNVSHVAVRPDAPAGTVHNIMGQSHVDYQGSTVFLRTAAKLPVGNPVTQVKWMYRIVRPWNVFVEASVVAVGGPAGVSPRSNKGRKGASASASSPSSSCPLRKMICADYEKFASTSMTDTTVRQAIGDNFPIPKAEVSAWEIISNKNNSSISDGDASEIADVVCRVVNGEAAFGVHWSPVVVKALFPSEDLVFCVRRGGPNGSISDVILYRTMTPLNSDTMAVGVLTAVFCPTVPKGRRPAVCAAVAALVVQVDVLFTTNTFGMANADLVNAFYDDLPGSLEKVYCLAGVDRVSSLPAAMTPSAVYVPFL